MLLNATVGAASGALADVGITDRFMKELATVLIPSKISALRPNEKAHLGQGPGTGRTEGSGRQNLYDLAFARGRSQTAGRLKRYKIGRPVSIYQEFPDDTPAPGVAGCLRLDFARNPSYRLPSCSICVRSASRPTSRRAAGQHFVCVYTLCASLRAGVADPAQAGGRHRWGHQSVPTTRRSSRSWLSSSSCFPSEVLTIASCSQRSRGFVSIMGTRLPTIHRYGPSSRIRYKVSLASLCAFLCGSGICLDRWRTLNLDK